MNRSQLVTALSERIETTRREADEVLTSIVDLITATVAAGEDVAISGFAKFRRVDRPARMGRNPATGETIRIKAKRSAKITPLKSFKDAVLSGKASAPAKKAPAKKTAAKKAPAKKAHRGSEEVDGPQARQEEHGPQGTGQEGAGPQGGEEDDRSSPVEHRDTKDSQRVRVPSDNTSRAPCALAKKTSGRLP